MRSILHVALVAPSGYSNAGLMKAFFDNGCTEYTCFDFQLKTFEFGKEAMRGMLIQEAERLKPDMIFFQVQMSDILDTQTFKRLSEISFTLNYTFDIRSKEQTEWLYNLAPVLGLICFSNQRDVDECNARGFNNVMVLQSSCDMDVYKQKESILEVDGYFWARPLQMKKVVFIGNNYVNTNIEFPLSKEREQMVKFLKNEFGNRFNVYGNNWGNSKLTTQEEEIDIYENSLIGVNQNNFDEELYCSDRIWRTMSCGVLCLTKYFKGIEKLFTRYEHLDWWETEDELKDQINYYLDHTLKAFQIAKRGMQHVQFNHSWTARVKEMMTFINSNIKVMDKDACNKAGAHVVDGIIPGPFDEHLKDRICDCGRTKWVWLECGCGEKTYQLRVQENI